MSGAASKWQGVILLRGVCVIPLIAANVKGEVSIQVGTRITPIKSRRLGKLNFRGRAARSRGTHLAGDLPGAAGRYVGIYTGI